MKGSLTPRAKLFVQANKTWRVVSGQWLDNDRKPVTGAPETWVKLRYRLTNGQQITLNQADRESLDAAGFKPVWYGISVSEPLP